MNNPADTTAPPPGILVAGHATELPEYHVRRSAGARRDWLITYTLHGSGRYRYTAGNLDCTPGDVVLLAPGTPHDYATSPITALWDFYWAHFTPRDTWTPWLQLPAASPGLTMRTVDDLASQQRIGEAFERVLRDSRGLGSFNGELALNALEEVVLLIAKHGALADNRLLDPRIEVVLRLLAEDLSIPLSISALAARIALSPSRLSHLFKQQLGEPIAEYRLRLRLRQAARLLEFTTRSVGEVALSVGFQSPFAFSRQFKAYYGVSPLGYRRQVVMG
jgi:AraC family transcriptional regulator, arabinose operon regulatory protein